MSDGCPVTPTGSPGDIEGLAASLVGANSGFQAAASALKQTASGLGGIDWSGPAEERFSSAAFGLATAASTYHHTLADVATTLRSYAHALQHAQRVIDEARTEYETAKTVQAHAQTIIGTLRVELGHVDTDQRAAVEDRIGEHQAAIRGASRSAEHALKRAVDAREDFDRAQRKATAALTGSSAPQTPTLGSLSGPFTNMDNGGTGGGLTGGEFGVPRGGLGQYSGEVPWDDVGDLDGLATNSWLDRNVSMEVDDLSNLIDGVLIVTGVGGLAKLGFNLARRVARKLAASSAARKAETEAAERAMTIDELAAKRLTDKDELRKTYIEKGGEVADKLEVIPQIENITKLLGIGSMTGNRIYVSVKVSQALAKIQAMKNSAEKGLAVLKATGALQRGVRRGIPKDVAARIEKMSDDVMQGGRSGQ